MNCFLDKRDVTMILDALKHMKETIEEKESLGIYNPWPYSKSDIEDMCNSFMEEK